MEQKTKLIVLSGLPVSGKSHIGEKVADKFNFNIVRSDEIRNHYFPTKVYGLHFKYSGGVSQIIYDYCFLKIENQLLKDVNTIFDATFLHYNGWKKLLEIAKVLDIEILIINTKCDDETAQNRLSEREQMDIGMYDHSSEAKSNIYNIMKGKLENSKTYIDISQDYKDRDLFEDFRFPILVVNTGQNPFVEEINSTELSSKIKDYLDDILRVF